MIRPTEITVSVNDLEFTYPGRKRGQLPHPVLNRVTFSVEHREYFALLGPNGSGKSTLFRILSTLLRPAGGVVTILGLDLLRNRLEIRRRMGIVFQHPSVDGKLTAHENLLHHGHCYGMTGRDLEKRIGESLDSVGLPDRAGDLVERLSGGMQRRVELAKALLHRPEILILDEPGTGLDPAARRDFTSHLRRLAREQGVTILLTTHLLDEAEAADRVGILDNGAMIAVDTPDGLRREIGGDVLTLSTPHPERLRKCVQERFNVSAAIVGQSLRIEHPEAHRLIPEIMNSYHDIIGTVTLAKPSMEDVFFHKTGHTFDPQREEERHE